MFDVKKTPRRVVKMASLGCLVTLALVATLLITGHAAPQRREPRGTSSHARADDRILADEFRLELESSSKSRSPSSPNPGSSSGFLDQAKPQKGYSEVPKKYSSKPPKDTSKTPATSTPIPPPNPQVYLLPTENVKLVFPDDDETVMAANLRALDDQLGRPSDLHAIILESGEDADTFSRALHDFQERTYNAKKVTETQDPTYQQDLLQDQFQYQALLAHQTKPSKRHQAHLQPMPSPLVYHRPQLIEADPFLLQRHPRQAVYRQHKETYRGHRRRRSLLEVDYENDVPTSISRGKRLSENYIYRSVLRKTRAPDDESSESFSDERSKFRSDESDERPRAKPNATPMKLSLISNATMSSSIQDKSSQKVKSKKDPVAGQSEAAPVTEVASGTQFPGTAPALEQKLLSQLALDVSSSLETDDLLDYPNEINGISSQSGSAEDGSISGTASPAVLMEADRDSGEISSESPGSKESLETFGSSEVSSESSSSVEKSSESPESSEVSSESSSSVERSSGSSESVDSSEVSSEADNSAEKSFESPESSESIDSAEISSEAPESSEMSSEDLDSGESSSESSSSSQKSSEDPESSETSSENPDSSESPDSLEFFDSSEFKKSPLMISKDQQGPIIISDLFDSSEGISGAPYSMEIISELGSESFRSSEGSPEILINVQVSPDMMDESRKIIEALSSLGEAITTSSPPTKKIPDFTNSFALDLGSLYNNGTNGLNSITVLPAENSTDYYTTALDSSELPLSVEIFGAYKGSTDEPAVYDDRTEFSDSSENYVDSTETLQSSRFDKPKVLDDAVRNSMNGKKDFNMTEQYPLGASTVSSGSDGQFEVEDLTGENGKDQEREMTENEDSNFQKNFAKSLDATGPLKLSGKKDGKKSSTSHAEPPEKGKGKSLESSLLEASAAETEEFGAESLMKTEDNLSFEATGVFG